jgi:uncharacterized protein (TIGR00266 family)
MQIEVKHGPANAAARIVLGARESITAEAGAMIAMAGDMAIETTTMKKGSRGVMKAIKRVLSGESFFLNHFTAGPNGGDVWLAPILPGDIMVQQLTGAGSLIVQGGSFLASSPDVNIDMNWQGFKSLFSGESIFWLKLSGNGQVVLNSFGAIYSVDVDGQSIVDSGHIVAFSEGLKFSITKAGKSWLSSILGGEGLVCRFEGKGRVWCQSHNPQGFGAAIGPLLKQRQA